MVKQAFSKSRTRVPYIVVWIFLILISVWMYINEGRYLHLLTVQFSSVGEEFSVSVLAGEERVTAFTKEDNVELKLFRAQIGQRELVSVNGNYVKANSEAQTELVFLYDDDNKEGNWTFTETQGAVQFYYSKTDMEHAGRPLYLLVPLIFGLSFVGPQMLMGRKDGKRVRGILREIGQTAEGLEALTAGERWLKRYWKNWERDKNLFGIALTAGSLMMLHGLWNSKAILNPYPQFRLWMLLAVVIVLGLYLRQIQFVKENIRILIKENRPMTAAAVFLTEVSYGGQVRLRRRILIHNAAAGLCHAGLYDLALETEELCALEEESAFWEYLHGNLKFTCLYRLGRWTEARQEGERLKELLRNNPRIAKRKDAQQVVFSMKISAAIMEQDEKKAQAYLELYREMVKDDYYLLGTVLWEAEFYARNGDENRAQELYDYLLRFSPENAVVRIAQSHGVCTYTEPKHLWKRTFSDRLVSGLMATVAGMFMMVVLVLCVAETPHFRQRDSGKTGRESIIRDTITEQETVAPPQESITPPQGTVEQPGENTGMMPETADMEIEKTSGIISTEWFSFELPADWENLAVVDIQEDGGVLVYERRSYDMMGGGELFGIIMLQDGQYVNMPDYSIWGYDGETVYVMWQPTDVTFYLEDADIQKTYHQMNQQMENIRETFRIHSDGARYDGSEFVFPNSNACYLEESCLWNLSEEKLRIARNEIYARHGRRFNDKVLQNYFDHCSWYEGTLAPSDFSEELLNEYERANILLMQQYDEHQ